MKNNRSLNSRAFISLRKTDFIFKKKPGKRKSSKDSAVSSKTNTQRNEGILCLTSYWFWWKIKQSVWQVAFTVFPVLVELICSRAQLSRSLKAVTVPVAMGRLLFSIFGGKGLFSSHVILELIYFSKSLNSSGTSACAVSYSLQLLEPPLSNGQLFYG